MSSEVQVPRWRDRFGWPADASLAVALLAVAILVLAPLAPDSTAAPDAPGGQPPPVPAESVVTMAALLDDGSSYSIRYVVDVDRTVGVAAAPDGSAFGVVVVSGSRIVARLRDLPADQGPVFDAFVWYEESIYWTETTIGPDGTDTTQLWAASVAARGVGEPRLVVPDMGFALLSGSAHDVIVADATISWAAVAGADEPGTLLRNVPVAGGNVSERAWPGAWRQIARPWLASTTPGATTLLNQDTGEQVTVPGSDVAGTRCAPDRCRVTVTSGTDAVRLELVTPDGTDRTRIAGPRTTFATIDPLALGRYELLSQTGGDLAAGQMRLLLYDAASERMVQVETGPMTLVTVRGGWAWWISGDFSAPVWHALDLSSLVP